MLEGAEHFGMPLQSSVVSHRPYKYFHGLVAPRGARCAERGPNARSLKMRSKEEQPFSFSLGHCQTMWPHFNGARQRPCVQDAQQAPGYFMNGLN